ncbi:MAG TPA: transporter substrate-binding domain-containing protein [Limnobacter sp.]|nr:transporter substrate-binding domain-containing protein [Limnobacter sp.]
MAHLVLGVSSPDYPPFDFIVQGKHYQGIGADYASLVAAKMKVTIRAVSFPSHAEAIRALQAGVIDLLGNANAFEAKPPGLSLSLPYLSDVPALAAKKDSDWFKLKNLDGLTIAASEDYLPKETLDKRFAGANISLHPSPAKALAAVVYGHADLVVGEQQTIQYLIEQHYPNAAQIVAVDPPRDTGLGFAVNSNNTALLHQINQAIQSIEPAEHALIARRWSVSTQSLAAKADNLPLPRPVLVAVDRSSPPLSYFDIEGQYQGITADLLAKISLHTGLQFEYLPVNGLAEAIEAVLQERAYMLVDFDPNQEREELLQFTRPYLNKPFVWIGKSAHPVASAPKSDASVAIALPKVHTLRPWIERQYPKATLLDTHNNSDSLERVIQGQAQYTLMNLSTANYYLSRRTDGLLTIVGELDARTASASFGVSKKHPDLLEALDRALSDIPPDEILALNNRWRSHAATQLSDWRDYKALIVQIALLFAIALSLFALWNICLRRQIKLREHAQNELADQLHFMATLVNDTPHPIYVRDVEGRLVTCNQHYLDVFGVELNNIVGKTAHESLLKTTKDSKEYLADYTTVVQTGLPMVQDRTLQVGEQVLTVYHWLLPYKSHSGSIEGVIGGWIDISDRKRLVDELSDAKTQAEQANAAKSLFLAMIGHEIKTPLNAVMGNLELALEKTQGCDLNRSTLQTALRSATELSRLIEDILDTAQLETGQLSINTTPTALWPLCDEIVDTFQAWAKQKQIRLERYCEGPASLTVHIDPLRLRQVLNNLLSNAVKYTTQGKIVLRVNARDQSDGTTRIEFVVSDTGLGIPAEYLSKLFKPFEKAHDLALNTGQGTGLGLYICKQLVQLMQGELNLQSEFGKGTAVTLTIDCHKATEDIDPPCELTSCEANPQTSLRVLVVDDHPANRKLLVQQLTHIGHTGLEMPNGADALQAFKAQHFDVVMTDCNMPTMDGYALSQAIRRQEQELDRPSCIIYGVTASGDPDTRQKCLQSGMDDCLVKPLGLSALRTTLKHAVITQGKTPFNFNALHRLAGGNPNDVNALLSTLLETNEVDLKALQASVVNTPSSEQADLVHRIKGAAKMIGAQRVLWCCETYENSKSNTNRQISAQKLVDELCALNAAMRRLHGQG